MAILDQKFLIVTQKLQITAKNCLWLPKICQSCPKNCHSRPKNRQITVKTCQSWLVVATLWGVTILYIMATGTCIRCSTFLAAIVCTWKNFYALELPWKYFGTREKNNRKVIICIRWTPPLWSDSYHFFKPFLQKWFKI